jgi:hypothetical protein
MSFDANDLVVALAQFHRDIFLPDFERLLTRALGSLEQRLNDHFDRLHKKLDRLDAESQRREAAARRTTGIP